MPTAAELDEAVRLLEAGQLVAFPTETVYGLGADAENPVAVARTAAERGITHLAITDHDRIDGALRARDAAVPGLTVIVGSEVRTAAGDLIALFLERPIAAESLGLKRRAEHGKGHGTDTRQRELARAEVVIHV